MKVGVQSWWPFHCGSKVLESLWQKCRCDEDNRKSWVELSVGCWVRLHSWWGTPLHVVDNSTISITRLGLFPNVIGIDTQNVRERHKSSFKVRKFQIVDEKFTASSSLWAVLARPIPPLPALQIIMLNESTCSLGEKPWNIAPSVRIMLPRAERTPSEVSLANFLYLTLKVSHRVE